jgi:hypothetical protein
LLFGQHQNFVNTHNGWQSFVSDPEVPATMKEAGHRANRCRPVECANFFANAGYASE